MPNESPQDHTALGPGLEFDLVRRLLSRWGDQARAIGDDAAVLDVPNGHRLVVSTDIAVEGVHFRREWLAPAEIGWRSTMAALSDLAAMGATPLGMLVALVLPHVQLPDVDELAAGIGEAAKASGTPILGGDLSRGEQLSIGVTVFGHTPAPVQRSGARPGDALYVTGQLGAARGALLAFAGGGTPTPSHRLRFARPVARLEEGRWLAEAGATAMIDISDGLAAELRHLAAASGRRLDVDVALVPTAEGATATQALESGEEYELLVAGPPALDVAQFTARFGLRLTRIGSVQAADEPSVRFQGGHGLVDLASGYDHFTS